MNQTCHEFILTTLYEVLPELKTVTLNMHDELYANCGIDSRIFISIIRKIEEYIGHEINDEDLLEAELITIQDLIHFVEKVK